jgi:SnoaL-like domain
MDLVALEEIRQAKYRYLRCVDLKLWPEMAEVFTPDATADYGSPATGQPLRFGSRDEIIAFLRGTWRFEDTVIATRYRLVIKGAAFYEDRYERGEDGRWRIAHTGYVRIYETTQSLDDLPSLKITANRWAAQSAG